MLEGVDRKSCSFAVRSQELQLRRGVVGVGPQELQFHDRRTRVGASRYVVGFVQHELQLRRSPAKN